MAWLRNAWTRFRTWLAGLLRESLTPREVGWAVGSGTFIGFLPIFGLHLPLCIFIARQLRVNQVITYGAAQLSNPVTAPFLIYAEIILGEWLRYGSVNEGDTAMAGDLGFAMLKEAPDLFVSCVVGSLALGLAASPPLGLLAAFVVRWRQNRSLLP